MHVPVCGYVQVRVVFLEGIRSPAARVIGRSEPSFQSLIIRH